MGFTTMDSIMTKLIIFTKQKTKSTTDMKSRKNWEEGHLVLLSDAMITN